MNRRIPTLILLWLTCAPLIATGGNLQSGTYFITQSWSQETGFKRPYYVNVPEAAGRQPLPVLLFLHGNGGQAERAMKGFLGKHRVLAKRYITVFPNGYKASWNIVSERSKADDRGFIEAIVQQLAEHDNVQAETFTIMGSSNGAALVNQLAIECRLPNIRNYVAAVSPLNAYQHNGKNFKAKGADNKYQQAVTPRTGIRLMNISGTEDGLVPYRGGPSKSIPAKGGKLSFVDAEESIYLWAKAMGYKGTKLSGPSAVDGELEALRYLDGDLVHYKVVGAGHGAGGAIREQTLLNFLEKKQ